MAQNDKQTASRIQARKAHTELMNELHVLQKQINEKISKFEDVEDVNWSNVGDVGRMIEQFEQILGIKG